MKNNSNNNLSNLNNNQESGCKIFVGGLTWNTTKEMLQQEFTKHGEIVDSIVMKNVETGNSRGFGFVTFKDNMSAENAVNSGPHKIDGKIVDVKLCNPRLAAQQRNLKQRNDNCKIFVGGLPHGVTDDEIKQFFSRYGHVKEFKMMYDENKQRPRGFGFITFELEDSANQVLQEHYIQFNGKQIEVKPQIHNVKQQYSNTNQMQHQQHQQKLPQHMQQQTQPHYGMGNGNGIGNHWNQNWNPAAVNATPNLAQAATNGNWGNYGNNLANPALAAQSWGYSPSPQTTVTGPGYPNQAPAQSNWNYNYYGQPPQQQGYYASDSTGTGTFNF